jgi:hypothetical protein
MDSNHHPNKKKKLQAKPNRAANELTKENSWHKL